MCVPDQVSPSTMFKISCRKLLAMVVAAVVQSLPDIRRYLEMRQM